MAVLVLHECKMQTPVVAVKDKSLNLFKRKTCIVTSNDEDLKQYTIWLLGITYFDR